MEEISDAIFETEQSVIPNLEVIKGYPETGGAALCAEAQYLL